MTSFNDITIEKLEEYFELLEDWEERYAYLIELGKKLPAMQETLKTESNRVKGCQATVWLADSINNETEPKLRLEADSNSTIVKGLVAVLLILFNQKTPAQILEIDPKSALAKLQLEQHLSPTRKTGLLAMTQQIQARAKSLQEKGSTESAS